MPASAPAAARRRVRSPASAAITGAAAPASSTARGLNADHVAAHKIPTAPRDRLKWFLSHRCLTGPAAASAIAWPSPKTIAAATTTTQPTLSSALAASASDGADASEACAASPAASHAHQQHFTTTVATAATAEALVAHVEAIGRPRVAALFGRAHQPALAAALAGAACSPIHEILETGLHGAAMRAARAAMFGACALRPQVADPALVTQFYVEALSVFLTEEMSMASIEAIAVCACGLPADVLVKALRVRVKGVAAGGGAGLSLVHAARVDLATVRVADSDSDWLDEDASLRDSSDDEDAGAGDVDDDDGDDPDFVDDDDDDGGRRRGGRGRRGGRAPPQRRTAAKHAAAAGGRRGGATAQNNNKKSTGRVVVMPAGPSKASLIEFIVGVVFPLKSIGFDPLKGWAPAQ